MAWQHYFLFNNLSLSNSSPRRPTLLRDEAIRVQKILERPNHKKNLNALVSLGNLKKYKFLPESARTPGPIRPRDKKHKNKGKQVHHKGKLSLALQQIVSAAKQLNSHITTCPL